MVCKAKHFSDTTGAMNRIMTAKTGAQAKAAGKTIRPCRADEWERVAPELITPGLLEKFRQSEDLLTLILASHPKSFIECSGFDRFWGAYWPLSAVELGKRPVFTGKNKMGELLDHVRSLLRQENLHLITSSDPEPTPMEETVVSAESSGEE